MIKLGVKGYCQNCGEFEIELAEFIDEKNRKVFLISCKNQSKCDAIEYYLSHRAAGNVEMKIKDKPKIM